MRRVPGYGDFDVSRFVEAVRASGFQGPWGNEILSEEYRRRGMESAYRHTDEGALSVLTGGAPDDGDSDGDDGGTETPEGTPAGAPTDAPNGTTIRTPNGTTTDSPAGTPDT
ncbi:hypothetical protein [Halobaculum gomorrense]|uniref:hypothetical protein n=1 Tax=Halobaculum gomorrense TaxID=43928 RepID=UPI000932B16F|nr:hypothetical protein [Halobaculum gomorrense]